MRYMCCFHLVENQHSMQGVDDFKSGAYVEGMLPAPRHEGDIMILSCVVHPRPPNLVQIVGKL
jgi:hypothetical protein